MINFEDYNNDYIQDLPPKFVNNILQILTEHQKYIQDQQKKANNAQTDFQKKLFTDAVFELQAEKRGMIKLLQLLGLHPVYGWSGHYGEYFFPTQEDCEMQEDWLWQCRD